MLNNKKIGSVSGTGWCRSANEYFAKWIGLNRPFFDLSKEFLPLNPKNECIHVPGVGPGFELKFLHDVYPNSPILASDISPEMVKNAKTRYNAPFYFLGDISAIPVQSVFASVSYFTVHLVRYSFEAIKSQYDSLVPGGKIFAVYFPPTPIGKEGPLVSLHRASHTLSPRPDSDWEAQSLSFLRETGASDVELTHLNAHWEFDSVQDLRETMEVLPHIRGIRKRAGEEFYNKLWSLCLDDPGLSFDGTRWKGPVGATILTATKS